MTRRRSPPRLGPLAMIVIAGLASSGPAAPPQDGPTAGRLALATAVHDGVEPASIDAGRSRWRRTAAAEEPPLVVPTSEMIRWGVCPPWPTGPTVLLADGGVLAGRIVARDERSVVVDTATFGRLTLPADTVRGWRGGPGLGPGPLAWAETPADRPIGVLLANGDRIAARRLVWRDGSLTVEPATDRTDAAASPVTIPAAVVRAVDFAPPDPARPVDAEPTILVAVMDGSRCMISALEPAAATARVRLALRLPGAAVVAECDTDELQAIAVDGGRAVLLALHAPDAYEQRSTLGPAWPLARGHSLTGDWPGLRGATAFSALGIHATANVRYRLTGPAARFQSHVAIDDSAAQGGSVVVRVLAGEPRTPGQELYSSGVIRGGEPPVRIDVPVPAAATDLRLVVESADGDDILDRTLWLDPVVVRAAD